MKLIYINNPHNKKDNDFLSTVNSKHNIEVMDFMKAKNSIDIRTTPTIVLMHSGLDFSSENISCVLDNPTLADIDKALEKEYPIPFVESKTTIDDYLLDLDFRLSMLELGF